MSNNNPPSKRRTYEIEIRGLKQTILKYESQMNDLMQKIRSLEATNLSLQQDVKSRSDMSVKYNRLEHERLVETKKLENRITAYLSCIDGLVMLLGERRK